MVKVFTLNKNGKIEFTKDELEKLLNETWNDGYYRHGTYWWTSPTVNFPQTGVPTGVPYYTTSVSTDETITVNCGADMRGDNYEK